MKLFAEKHGPPGSLVHTDRRDAMAKQNRLLVTKTVRLKKEGLNVRYAELGDPAKPTVLLLHGVPENLQAWYAVAPLLAETQPAPSICDSPASL